MMSPCGGEWFLFFTESGNESGKTKRETERPETKQVQWIQGDALHRGVKCREPLLDQKVSATV